MFNFDSLCGFIDRYFGFYSENPVSSYKIGVELINWLTVNFMFEFISCDDLSKAISYVNKQVQKREGKI